MNCEHYVTIVCLWGFICLQIDLCLPAFTQRRRVSFWKAKSSKTVYFSWELHYHSLIHSFSDPLELFEGRGDKSLYQPWAEGTHTNRNTISVSRRGAKLKSICSIVRTFALWKETGTPGGNPCQQRKDANSSQKGPMTNPGTELGIFFFFVSIFYAYESCVFSHLWYVYQPEAEPGPHWY